MKKNLIILLTSLTVFAVMIAPRGVAQAETVQELSERLQKEITEKAKELESIKKQQEDVQAKIKKEEATQKNLSTSINYITYQIQSTELTIEEKEGQIEKNEVELQILGAEIENRQNQILNLEDSITYLEEVIDTRNKTNYINSKVSWFEYLLSSENLSKAVKQLEYFGEIKKHDLQLLEDMESNRLSLTDEKLQLDRQKTEVERLKAEIEFEKEELEKAKIDLAWQKTQKNQMFAESTKREDEQINHFNNLSQEYRNKIRELNALQAQLAQSTVSGTEVKEGWIIGKQGATGNVWTKKDGVWVEGDGICEGYHIHFMVWEKNPSTGRWYHVNPAKYILSGKLKRPFKDGEYVISQHYGYTSFNPDHNAIDYVGTQGCGAPVYAAGDGIIQYGYDGKSPGPNDPKGAYYAWIDHGKIDGIEVKTGYWHLMYP